MRQRIDHRQQRMLALHVHLRAKRIGWEPVGVHATSFCPQCADGRDVGVTMPVFT
jgi:hypothetical protein